ncbi:major facilitator superfamily domain-containing protein, partial [Pavlovales sp. CCMP2436]
WRTQALLPALLAVFVHNQWSRSLLYYTCEFGLSANDPAAARQLMNVELGFGTEAYGFLAAIPFTLVFAPLSLLAGGAADASNRARLTWLSLLGWSAATAWQGSARSIEEVAASRALQGLCQAFTTPAAFTLLADATPQARRGTVNSAYSTGVYIGGGLAALSILLDRAVGWRSTLHVSAAVGVLLAAAVAVSIEDMREEARAAELVPERAPAKPRLDVRALARSQMASLGRTWQAVAERPAVQLLLASCALRFCAGFAIAVWVGPWGREAFPDRQTDFGLTKAAISALGGGFSAIAGGVLSDILGERDASRRLYLPVAGSLGAAVCWGMMMDAQSFEWAMGWLLLQYLFAECWFGAAIATLQGQLPKEVQGGAQGAFSTLTVFGNLAPLLIGQASQHMPLADVLHATVPALYLGSAAAF